MSPTEVNRKRLHNLVRIGKLHRRTPRTRVSSKSIKKGVEEAGVG